MCNHRLAHQEALAAFERVLDTMTATESNLTPAYKAYLKLIEEIPLCLPNGTGIFTDIGWIRWAKKELGYRVEEV